MTNTLHIQRLATLALTALVGCVTRASAPTTPPQTCPLDRPASDSCGVAIAGSVPPAEGREVYFRSTLSVDMGEPWGDWTRAVLKGPRGGVLRSHRWSDPTGQHVFVLPDAPLAPDAWHSLELRCPCGTFDTIPFKTSATGHRQDPATLEGVAFGLDLLSGPPSLSRDLLAGLTGDQATVMVMPSTIPRGQTMSLALAAMLPGGKEQDHCQATRKVDVAWDYSANPWFELRSDELRLPTSGGMLDLQDVVLAGDVGPDGLWGLELLALVAVADDAPQCSELQCVSCAGGLCADIQLRGLRAPRLEAPLLQVGLREADERTAFGACSP